MPRPLTLLRVALPPSTGQARPPADRARPLGHDDGALERPRAPHGTVRPRGQAAQGRRGGCVVAQRLCPALVCRLTDPFASRPPRSQGQGARAVPHGDADGARDDHHGLGRPHAVPVAAAARGGGGGRAQEVGRAPDRPPEGRFARVLLARRPAGRLGRPRQLCQDLGRRDRPVPGEPPRARRRRLPPGVVVRLADGHQREQGLDAQDLGPQD